jgi:hypothetical protein
VFGYFFGPECERVPDSRAVMLHRPQGAVWRGMLGALGLINGAWPVIGQSVTWSREDWPLPEFVRVDALAGRAWKVTYSDDLNRVSETECDPCLAQSHPDDGVYGYGAVEIVLTRLLRSS